MLGNKDSFQWFTEFVLPLALINGSGSFACAQRGKLDPYSHHVAIS